MSEPTRSGFTERQRAAAYPPGIGDHFWLLSRNRIVYDTLGRASAGAPLLDLGCGPGATVQYLRSRGLDCDGADLVPYDPVAPELAGALRYGEDPFALPLAYRSRFRTVLLLDLLEHVHEPSAFVRRCVLAFPHVAHLLITLPARQELWSNYDAYYGHTRRYDRASAAALCRDAGADVIECGYFFHSLYLMLALQRLLSIERPVEFGAIRHVRLHRLVAGYLHLEARWLPDALPGSSLLVTARVPR